MCGIHVVVTKVHPNELSTSDAALLRSRGPDSLNTKIVSTRDHTWHIKVSSSVLHLRGDQVTEQPLFDDESGCFLCWNGEIWSYDGSAISGNDTTFLFPRLLAATTQAGGSRSVVARVLSRIAGPYAFVFYDAKHNMLYHGRDPLGRRSLLTEDSLADDDKLTISSVASDDRNSLWGEVDARWLWTVNLSGCDGLRERLDRPGKSPTINNLLPSYEETLLTRPSDLSIANLQSSLGEAIEIRVKDIPSSNIAPQNTTNSGASAKVAILFSGGLDCTLLARIVHDILPASTIVDLLNVAFENPRIQTARKAEQADHGSTLSDPYETCPDRVTGRSSHQELTRVCSTRTWRFIAINIEYKEYLKHTGKIAQLMYPHNTEMDLSITAALYFAAKGEGLVSALGSERMEPYVTTARVLLSGLGADELFGGYSRHAAAYTRAGYEALISELGLDFDRIGTRNLGRDDRVIAHWAKEVRYPFLDESFVKFALDLPVWEKCGFRKGRHVAKHFEPNIELPEQMEDLDPAKMMLRCLLWKLGMPRAAQEKKRAIQFGARTAKMRSGKSKGTDLLDLKAL